jgi:hypothetical protein
MVRNLPGPPKLFGVFNLPRHQEVRCWLLSLEPSAPASSCRSWSDRACLKASPCTLTAWLAVGTTVLMRAHIHRLTILLLTHVRRTRSPCISRVEQRPCDRAYYLIEPSLHAAHSALHLISGPAWCGRPRGLWPEGGGGSIPPWAPTLGCRDPLPNPHPHPHLIAV